MPIRPQSRFATHASLYGLGSGALWVTFAGLMGTNAVNAQITPQPRGGDFIAHRVVAGDTLEMLAARYLGDRTHWTALQRHNRVDNPFQLRPGSVLEIPTRLLRAATASVEFVQGDVRSSRSLSHLADNANTDSATSQAVQKGQLLQEGDSLKVPANAFVSVRLADGSLVRVQSESDVELRQMRRKGRAGSLQSVIDLREGGVEASVPKQANGERRFEVRTLAASTSVRGTQFLVLTDAAGQTAAAVDEGSVAVQAGQPSALLKPGQGLAVSAGGPLGKPAAMLGAPDIAAWPALAEDANWVSLPLPAMPGAVRYQVQLAKDKDFTQIVRGGMFTQSPARLIGVEDGNYIAAIRAIDANGIPGARSLQALRVKAHPVPPHYESPEPDATIGLGQRGLQCTKVTEASAYRIQVASAAGNFSQPLLDASDLKDCILPADALAKLPVGEYQWRVASIRTLSNGQLDAGPFAAPQKMKLAQAPKSLDLQLDGGAGEGSRSIRWAGEEGQRYHIVVASEPGFATPVVDTWITQPQWSTQDLPAGAYYLQMQVEDRNGLRSNFSAARQFQTGNWVTSAEGQTLTSGDGSHLTRQ
ncbi:FecR domain-containing protein [Comamonas sp. 26]|uniref:FecR family protein n=1 Tax=Comamonas sp. 26 TaxID=2035201 RepID=UPI000C647CA8|nr:FecR family protein [Comamonas sp. 26]